MSILAPPTDHPAYALASPLNLCRLVLCLQCGQFPGLKFAVDGYCSVDGKEMQLMKAEGTVPIHHQVTIWPATPQQQGMHSAVPKGNPYSCKTIFGPALPAQIMKQTVADSECCSAAQGNKYNIPVLMWFPETFPQAAPLIYVRPTANMVIKGGHKNVNASGLVNTPCLWNWSSPMSTLLDAITEMSICFGSVPPLYSMPANYTPPAPVTTTSNPLHSPSGGTNGYVARPAPPPGASYTLLLVLQQSHSHFDSLVAISNQRYNESGFVR